MLPSDLDLPRMIALVLIFVLWASYGPLLNTLGRGTLNAQLHVVRMRWMRMLLNSHRENRVFDAILLGHISNSMSFFGSATLIVLAGLLGTLTSINRVHAALMEMQFFPPTSLSLFTTYFVVLTIIVAWSFFSFTYALRKLAYSLAMMGGLNESKTQTRYCTDMVAQTAVVLTEAVKSLNTGIRGFYFAVAALFLFAGPYISMIATLAVAALEFYRQGLSTESLAIERYVNAMNALETEAEHKSTK
ncbi:MAG: DUF599 family protein [Proteobacteria bacterium]|nr:DUF599 family protein [Pseudomonadota bacterium]